MRAPPTHLSHQLLGTCLRDRYGLDIVELTFLARGSDASAWVYRARTADASAYFLKVRVGTVNATGLRVPRYLWDQGIPGVVAPLPTSAGPLWTTVAGSTLILYPFIAGRVDREHDLSEQQWIDFGAIVRRIHATVPPPDLVGVMRCESYRPEGADITRRLDAHLGAQGGEDTATAAFAALWRTHRRTIWTVLGRAEQLGRHLARSARALVICHTDLHTNNVVLDADERVWIVDWDETMLAPRERDLMFVVGGGLRRDMVGPRQQGLFFQGYGATSVDPLALAYYRSARAVSDLVDIGAQVCFRPDLGLETRRWAADRCGLLFAPGGTVELALQPEGPER